MDYIDFDVEIRESDNYRYSVHVRSVVGEAQVSAPFPFTDAQLETNVVKLENAILRAGGRRRTILSTEEQEVQAFGNALFDFLLSGEARSLYYECQREATHQGVGVRLKLHIQTPTLATLPWEFLYDPRREYLCLDPYTPVIRYLDLAQPIQPITVTPPLRILGMVASPQDLQRLDVEQEKQRLEQAVHGLQEEGLVELTWLEGQSWRELQREMRTGRGPWHIFHFIGHGGFDVYRDEGLVMFADAQQQAHRISATQLSRLIARQRNSLRLIFLNTCDGARGGKEDVLSSTAATLVRSGIPAVLAMQYEITNDAAIEFSRTFYEALTDGLPVDTAVADARNAINLRDESSLEWGTPVLYSRTADGMIFDIKRGEAVRTDTGEQPLPQQPGTIEEAVEQQAEPEPTAVVEEQPEEVVSEKETKKQPSDEDVLSQNETKQEEEPPEKQPTIPATPKVEAQNTEQLRAERAQVTEEKSRLEGQEERQTVSATPKKAEPKQERRKIGYRRQWGLGVAALLIIAVGLFYGIKFLSGLGAPAISTAPTVSTWTNPIDDAVYVKVPVGAFVHDSLKARQ